MCYAVIRNPFLSVDSKWFYSFRHRDTERYIYIYRERERERVVIAVDVVTPTIIVELIWLFEKGVVIIIRGMAYGDK